jgi:hypothetical protein
MVSRGRAADPGAAARIDHNKELGSEHFTRRSKEHTAKRLEKRLEDLGFTVEVRPATAGVSI